MEISHFAWSQWNVGVLSAIWRYHWQWIEFNLAKDCFGQFSYFLKKLRNCNLNSGKAIEHFPVPCKITYFAQRDDQSIWNHSCPCLAIWWAEEMENGQCNPAHSCLFFLFSFFFTRDKKIALHYIPLNSLGCESQWHMSLSFKMAKHMWDWLLWGWPRIINQWQ